MKLAEVTGFIQYENDIQNQIKTKNQKFSLQEFRQIFSQAWIIWEA